MSRKNGNNNSVDLDIGTLSGHLWEAANILRGPVDAADFKTYIFPLLFFKRLSDVYDEEYAVALEESDGDVEFAQFPENHRFQVPEGCHWKDVRAKSANIGHALQKAMRASSRLTRTPCTASSAMPSGPIKTAFRTRCSRT